MSIRSCQCTVPNFLPASGLTQSKSPSRGQGPQGPTGSGLLPDHSSSMTGMFPPQRLCSLFRLGCSSSGYWHDIFPLLSHCGSNVTFSKWPSLTRAPPQRAPLPIPAMPHTLLPCYAVFVSLVRAQWPDTLSEPGAMGKMSQPPADTGQHLDPHMWSKRSDPEIPSPPPCLLPVRC